jgi:(1->4)-alpha-D-glucan 1-alpha-D-glucosylmutase
MTEHERLIREVADLAGVAGETHDAFGRRNPVPEETRRAVLTGLGVPVDTASEARASLQRLTLLRRGLLPPVMAADAGRNLTIRLRAERDAAVAEWRLTNAETRDTREGRGQLSEAGEVRLPMLDAGYYSLEVEAGGARDTATVVAAPPRCFVPDALSDGDRLWGLSVQLIALRSAADFGIGDFGSVREAVERVAPYGASFLGLSPMHALFAADRSKYGPYGPSSRLMLDPIHIDVSAFAEAQGVALPKPLRALSLTDHKAVWEAKLPILERAFAAAGNRPSTVPEDSQVHGHATFEALSEHFGPEGRSSAADWPGPYRNPRSPDVRRFRDGRADRVAFHAWLQEMAATQLGAASEEARRRGMAIGLYADLAVGADAGGSEVWSHSARYASSLSIGAPPDPLAPQGQDWGIAALNPLVLEEEGLAGFRDLIRANMRHVGALRIDHAFQLQRLYLVPKGETRLPGTYVEYPFEALLAVLRLESHRAKCMVIGEDLGTAPPGFSERMMEAGVLSYRVLFFEREHDAFRSPSAYPETALAVFTTHDLPTIRGWWSARDIDVRRELDLLTGEEAADARSQREHDKVRLMEALGREGLAETTTPPQEPPVEAIVRFLARSRSQLAALQLEDVAGEVEQANLPGTVEGHPNWRRRLSLELSEIATPDGPLARLAAAFRGEGRGEKGDGR